MSAATETRPFRLVLVRDLQPGDYLVTYRDTVADVVRTNENSVQLRVNGYDETFVLRGDREVGVR